jgi:hypothetical protein
MATQNVRESGRASVAALIIFLKCFVTYSLGMGVVLSFESWPPGWVNVSLAVFAGVLFGTLLTAMDVVRLRRHRIEPRLWNSVRHDRTIALPLSSEEAVRLADQAARSWGWKVRGVDADGRKVALKVRMSRQSWGERVTVTAHPTVTGCEARISSRPALPWVWIDYGRNVVNVRQVAAFLTEHAPISRML